MGLGHKGQPASGFFEEADKWAMILVMYLFRLDLLWAKGLGNRVTVGMYWFQIGVL